MKAVIQIKILHVMVYHEKEFLPGLGNPVQAHVDTDGLTDIVILHQVHP